VLSNNVNDWQKFQKIWNIQIQGLFKDLLCFQGLSRAWNYFRNSRTSQGPHEPWVVALLNIAMFVPNTYLLVLSAGRWSTTGDFVTCWLFLSSVCCGEWWGSSSSEIKLAAACCVLVSGETAASSSAGADILLVSWIVSSSPSSSPYADTRLAIACVLSLGTRDPAIMSAAQQYNTYTSHVNCKLVPFNTAHIQGLYMTWDFWLGPKVGGCLCPVLHSWHELGNVLQWLCHNDSTINTDLGIIIKVLYPLPAAGMWTSPILCQQDNANINPNPIRIAVVVVRHCLYWGDVPKRWGIPPDSHSPGTHLWHQSHHGSSLAFCCAIISVMPTILYCSFTFRPWLPRANLAKSSQSPSPLAVNIPGTPAGRGYTTY